VTAIARTAEDYPQRPAQPLRASILKRLVAADGTWTGA